MKVTLVTGATGVLGIQLVCSLIRRDEKVIAIYNSESSLIWSNRVLQYEGISDAQLSLIEWKKVDIEDVFSLGALS